MADSNYIMFMKSERVKSLITEHPFAFVILSLVAQRARWNPGICPDTGLEQGEALIGASDFEGHRKNCGLSRSNYRSGLNKLLSIGLLTVKVTNRGTIAKLCDSSVYDLNLNGTHRPSHLEVTSKSPLTKKVKKERIATLKSDSNESSLSLESAYAQPEKYKVFFSNLLSTEQNEKKLGRVILLISDLEKLVKEFGGTLVMEKINAFSEELAQGKYLDRDHYSTIRNWCRRTKSEPLGQKFDKSPSVITPEMNKKLAEEMINKITLDVFSKRNFRVEFFTNEIEICPVNAGNYQPFCLRYTEKGFTQQLESFLRKIRII